MVEVVACVEAVGTACKPAAIPLDDISPEASFSFGQQDVFREVAQKAIINAVAEPPQGGPVEMYRASMSGAGGDIANLKSELVTGPNAASAQPVQSERPEYKMAEEVTARIRSLYMDLTQYSVAWKIGHKVQQDISQILRGQ